jgi:hypothetical protein
VWGEPVTTSYGEIAGFLHGKGKFNESGRGCILHNALLPAQSRPCLWISLRKVMTLCKIALWLAKSFCYAWDLIKWSFWSGDIFNNDLRFKELWAFSFINRN